jgi:hypothetical protein
MKNLYLLQTDKPSKVYTIRDIDSLGWSEGYLQKIGNSDNLNIYITSNNEIKEGDWFLDEVDNLIHKAHKDFSVFKTNVGSTRKKIILTTDQDLIKDGVQAIDDEFLKWFVKNPSCEEVGVDEEFLKLVHNPNYVNHTPDSDGIYLTPKSEDLQYGETIIEEDVINYKIIIPKEDLGYTTNLGAEVSDEMARALMIPKELFGLRQFVGSSSKYKDEDFSASLSDEMGQWLRPNKVTRVEQVKDLQFWRENAEEDYLRVPISVLKYISKLETELETVYREEEVRGILIKFHNELPNRWEIDKWFEQFKKK